MPRYRIQRRQQKKKVTEVSARHNTSLTATSFYKKQHLFFSISLFSEFGLSVKCNLILSEIKLIFNYQGHTILTYHFNTFMKVLHGTNNTSNSRKMYEKHRVLTTTFCCDISNPERLKSLPSVGNPPSTIGISTQPLFANISDVQR